MANRLQTLQVDVGTFNRSVSMSMDGDIDKAYISQSNIGWLHSSEFISAPNAQACLIIHLFNDASPIAFIKVDW